MCQPSDFSQISAKLGLQYCFYTPPPRHTLPKVLVDAEAKVAQVVAFMDDGIDESSGTTKARLF